jgi:alpha-tubulin suppressor-like RCC1 family protein
MKPYCGQRKAASETAAFFKIMKTKRNLIQIWLLCVLMLQALTSGAQPVTNVVAGGYHSLFLKSDGSLWAMGYDNHGQLGDGIPGVINGVSTQTNRPEQTVASNVTAIAGGVVHSLFLKSDGSLWAMGSNASGELGDGTNNQTNQPEQIVASNVTTIAAGTFHSLFLKNNGSLWAMGYNVYGALGDGTYNTNGIYGTNKPEQIVASNVTAIAAGYEFSLFLKNDGSLWAMGWNYLGQLGDGTYGTAYPFATNQPEQIVASNVTAIAAGYAHSLFLKSDGSLWAMGENDFGELGDGTYNPVFPLESNGTNSPEQIVASNVTAIAGGVYHSLFLKSDGSLWVMGYNQYGQLGDGTTNDAHLPEKIVADNVIAIAAGDYHSLFVKSDGSLWTMGDNQEGQLGDGTTNSVNRPEQILAAYNRITGQRLGGTNMQLSFVGIANANYALDRSSSLSPPNWIPQATNAAGSFGALVFTNPPDASTNNFWRIRSAPQM